MRRYAAVISVVLFCCGLWAVAHSQVLTILTPSPGAVTGAIKSNGAGSFSQAACSDLSNSGTGCAGTSAPCSAFGTATGQCAEGGVITAGGPTGSATVAPIITYNAAGQVTAVSSATITPAIGSVTGLGTGVATALGNGFGSTSTTFTVGNDARLGAGAVTGAIKSNGSNTFAQAASSDLSDAGAWSTSSPSLGCGTGSPTTASVAVRYKQFLGKTVAFQAIVTITTVGTCSGYLDFNAPVTPNSTGSIYPLSGFDNTTGAAVLTASVRNSNAQIVFTPAAVTTDTYYIGGTYEAN